MTPAITQLDELGIAYKLHQYCHNTAGGDYGNEAVEMLDVSANRVFKTLVIEGSHQQYALALIAVAHRLQLKQAAQALGCKKAVMADARSIPRITGYVAGGVSPLGQSKSLPVLIDAHAIAFPTIFVSAGKRGLEIELQPQALCQATAGRFASLTGATA